LGLFFCIITMAIIIKELIIRINIIDDAKITNYIKTNFNNKIDRDVKKSEIRHIVNSDSKNER